MRSAVKKDYVARSDIGAVALAVASAAALAVPGAALAATTVPPDFTVSINDETTLGSGDLGLQLVDGTTLWRTNGTAETSGFGVEWDLDVDPDPIIGGSFSLTNRTNGTQNYSVFFDLPINAPVNPALHRGEVSVTISDDDGSGFAAVSNFDWYGLIDGTRALDIVALDADCTGVSCSFTLGPVSEAFEIYALGAQNNIGIELLFDLSGGDRVSITSEYEVAPVPLPGAVWLLLPALIGLRRLAR